MHGSVAGQAGDKEAGQATVEPVAHKNRLAARSGRAPTCRNVKRKDREFSDGSCRQAGSAMTAVAGRSEAAP